MTATHKTEADSIAALAAEAERTPQIIRTFVGDREFLFQPTGWTHTELRDPHELPPHIRQNVTLETIDSLGEYVIDFKTATTLLFAYIATNSIVAVIDYHAASGGDVDIIGEPHHLAHRATLALPFSQEWKTWATVDGKLMTQLEFARFLEENAPDVLAPSGADLLEICRDLQARRKVDFRKAVRTATDNESFEYTEETTAGTKNGDVEIPTKFRLSIPVYFGDATVSLDAFLRWNLTDAGLVLGVALHRAEHVRQAVFRSHVEALAHRTQCRAVFGRLG